MKTSQIFSAARAAAIFLACLGVLKTGAQTSWNSATSAIWNTAASWNPATVPGVGTATFITNSGTFTVTYNSPMAAASIGALTLGLNGSSASIPSLTVTANGFNVAGTTTLAGSSAEILNVNSGGVMNNGTLSLTSQNAVVTVSGVMTNATTQVANKPRHRLRACTLTSSTSQAASWS